MVEEGRRFSLSSFFKHQIDHPGRFTTQGLLHECVLRRLLSPRRLNLP
jgi:hypothetical protein